MSEWQISPRGQLRRRLLDACMDIVTDATDWQLESLCGTLESLAAGMREANAAGGRLPTTTDGNVVALPGVRFSPRVLGGGQRPCSRRQA